MLRTKKIKTVHETLRRQNRSGSYFCPEDEVCAQEDKIVEVPERLGELCIATTIHRRRNNGVLLAGVSLKQQIDRRQKNLKFTNAAALAKFFDPIA